MKLLSKWIILIATAIQKAVLVLAAVDAEDGFSQLVTWMKANGGRVDDRFGVTTNGIRGMIATAEIPDSGTELLFVPWHLIIGYHSEDDDHSGSNNQQEQMCRVIRTMAQEMELGMDSFWYPYLNYIELPRLPAEWNTTAIAELQGIPPAKQNDDVMRHIRWFQQICQPQQEFDSTTSRTTTISITMMNSLVAFVSRASEVGMIPIYDLFNHHNGQRNVKLKVLNNDDDGVVVGGVQLVTTTTNTISKGDALWLSYGMKVASTMFRDYGFIEEWPSCWNFIYQQENYAFCSFPDNVVAINPSSEYLKESIWQSNQVSLLEYQTSAQIHTESISNHDLQRFANAAKHYLKQLYADTTTLEQDLLLLQSRQKKYENDDDITSAMEYRIAYKRAITSALTSAEQAMAKQQEL